MDDDGSSARDDAIVLIVFVLALQRRLEWEAVLRQRGPIREDRPSGASL
jgi:hypothetical protein